MSIIQNCIKISPMKAALIHADRQTDKRKAKWRLCNYAKAHKKLMWQPNSKTYRQHYGCAWITSVKKQSLFCYLPIGVLKDICKSQLHVILPNRRHGLHFVQTVQWPKEISEQHLNVILWNSSEIYIFVIITSAKWNSTGHRNSKMCIGSFCIQGNCTRL